VTLKRIAHAKHIMLRTTMGNTRFDDDKYPPAIATKKFTHQAMSDYVLSSR
jgi:hypothetical protein